MYYSGTIVEVYCKVPQLCTFQYFRKYCDLSHTSFQLKKKTVSSIFFYPGGVHAKMQVYANNEHTGAKKKFVKFCYLGRTNRTVFFIFLQSLEFQILVFRSVDHCIIISRHFQPKLSFNKRRNFSQFPVRLWSQVSLK